MLHAKAVTVALLALLTPLAAAAETGTLCLLYTNDLHDHIRPGYEGVGGLPYVSGYVDQVRAERDDVLLVDAGDVMEKGDLVAFKTKSAIMYEAMERIGYDAGAIGNHDIDYGVAQFHKSRAKAPGMRSLCVNLFKDDGSLETPPNAIFDVEGLRVGVIGSIVPRDENSLDIEATAAAIAREAEALEDEVDLTIALCHQSSAACAYMAETARLVDVFVSGHSHELLRTPKRAPASGAYIVQAGSNARYVGRLDLAIDLRTGAVDKAEGQVVEMKHDAVPVDREMLAWIRARERELAPGASDVLGHAKEPLGALGLGRLAADALLDHSGADVAFCHPTRVMRNKLPKGDIDLNALYKTGGTYGARIYRFTLTGQQILQYVSALEADRGKGMTFISGLGLAGMPASEDVEAQVAPGRTYAAVMTYKEFDTRFLKMMRREQGLSGDAFPYETCGYSYTDALAAYARKLTAAGVDLADYASVADEAARLALAGGGGAVQSASAE